MMFRVNPNLPASRVEARLARRRAHVGLIVTLVVGVATFGAGVSTASAQGQPQSAGSVRVQTPPEDPTRPPDLSQTPAVALTVADDQSPAQPADPTQGPPAQPPQTGSTTAAGSGAGQGQSTAAPACTAPTGSDASGSTGSPQTAAPDCNCPTKNVTGQTTAKDRLFFLLPNFLTVHGTLLPPMTASQKFSVVTAGTFDPVEFPWYGFETAISESTHADPALGSGWGGFGKRYALNFANGTSENFMVGAIMPTIFHQDPRYYQMGSGGFWRRAGYAISRIVMTRTDCGRSTVNVSELLGAAATATVANLYQPHDERTLRNTLSVWGTQMGYDTLAYVLREFWPDIRKGLKHL
jgi:hypothetical protein